MQVRKLAVTAVVAVASFTALGLATPAYALCESYSGGCPTAPPGGGGGTDQPITGVDEQPGSGVDQPTSGTTDEGPTGGQTPVQGTAGQPGTDTVSTPAEAPATLPFTGGELVLLTAVGIGALAGGTALVVAGRRRTETV